MGKKQKKYDVLAKAYDLGRQQSTFTSSLPSNSNEPNSSPEYEERKKNAIKAIIKRKKKKTFREFCEDSNLTELFSLNDIVSNVF